MNDALTIFGTLSVGMAVKYGLLRLAEMLRPRSAFDPDTQWKSLRFWPFYIAGLTCAYLLGAAWLSYYDRPPLITIGGKTLYEATGLGWVNYIIWPIVGMVILDFFHYWRHRAQHHRLLWRFHAVHHSIENLSAINSYHYWADPLFSVFMVQIPMSILIGMDFPTFAVLAFLITMQGPFIHANARLHLGPFNRLIVDNRFHRIHHSIEERHFDKNFGESVTVWDQLFGTAYFPQRDEWPHTGLADQPEPRTLRECLLRPFRALWNVPNRGAGHTPIIP